MGNIDLRYVIENMTKLLPGPKNENSINPQKVEKPAEKNPNPFQKRYKLTFIDKIHIPMSFKHFIISHLVLLVSGTLFFGGLYWYLNKDNPKFDLNKYVPVTVKPQSLNLTVGYPDNESVIFEKNITLTGTSAPSAVVLISLESQNSDDSIGFEADSKGSFSKIISLYPGLNKITISAFDKLGNNKIETREVFYSEEKI